MGKLKSVAELESLRAQLLAAPDRPVVRVCLGPGCLAQGADKVSRAFKAAIKEHKIPADVKPLIKETGCHGFCSQGTLVNLHPFDLFYVQVKPADVPEIVDQTLREGKVVERLLYGTTAPATGPPRKCRSINCSKRSFSKMWGSSTPWTLKTPSRPGPTAPW